MSNIVVYDLDYILIKLFSNDSNRIDKYNNDKLVYLKLDFTFLLSPSLIGIFIFFLLF